MSLVQAVLQLKNTLIQPQTSDETFRDGLSQTVYTDFYRKFLGKTQPIQQIVRVFLIEKQRINKRIVKKE